MEKITRKVRQSELFDSSQKLWGHLISLLKTKKFEQQIIKLRTKYDIPLRGYRDSDSFKWPFSGNIPKTIEMYDDVRILSNSFLVSPIYESVCHYLFFNKLEKPKDPSPLMFVHDFLGEMTLLSNLKASGKNSDLNMNGVNKRIVKTHQESWEEFPIAIRISPYVSVRDINRFIAKNSGKIKELQKVYRKPNVNIDRTRRKNSFVEERNEFIYLNREIPLKEISLLLARKYGDKVKDLTVGHISKIISLENKRRNEM